MKDDLVGQPIIVVPYGAGPNDPAIILGNDPLPADLVAFYAGLGQTLIQAQIFQRTSTNYTYLALVVSGGLPFMAAGAASGGVVSEAWSVQRSGNQVGQFNVGSPFGGTMRIFMASGGDFQITYGGGPLVSQPRGVKAFVCSQANTGPVGAETQILTAPSAQYVLGRAYAATFYGDTLSDTAASTSVYRMRKTNGVGVDFWGSAWEMSNTVGFTENCDGRGLFTPAATFTATMALTLQGFGGNSTMVGSATQPRYFEIVDVGSAADYTNLPAI